MSFYHLTSNLEHPYTHEKLQKEFEENFILPDLEKKQKYLKELREFYQPLSKSAILSHQQSYENLKKKMENEYKAKREKNQSRYFFY